MLQTPKRLLVVGDSTILHDVRDELFSRGFEVTYCPSGKAALHHTRQNGLPYLMVVNLDLPDMNGLDLCREMYELAILPIIAVVDKDADTAGRAVRALSYADDYVRKPVNAHELLKRIERILSRVSNYSYAKGPEVEVCDYLTIDNLNRRVTVDGDRRDLTPTENALLRVLVKHLGKVVTTDTLVERVWRDGVSIGDRNALRVHMHRLRSKLKRRSGEEEDDLIVTERGVGYLLRGC
jgi:two-component system KDP operon response regulator KdpE